MYLNAKLAPQSEKMSRSLDLGELIHKCCILSDFRWIVFLQALCIQVFQNINTVVPLLVKTKDITIMKSDPKL